MIAVCVTLTLKAGQMDTFLPLLRAHGARCLKLEPGCHRFDIATDAGRADKLFIYELYAAKDAFDAHLQTAHFRAFDAEVSGMVADKDVVVWDTLETL